MASKSKTTKYQDLKNVTVFRIKELKLISFLMAILKGKEKEDKLVDLEYSIENGTDSVNYLK